MPAPRAVLFDLDGTLIDTPTAICETLEAVLAVFQKPSPSRAVLRSWIGLTLDVMLADFLGEAPTSEPVAEGIRLYRRIYAQRVVPRSKELLFPGVAAGLERLGAAGHRSAVVTSKVQAVAKATLEAAELAGHFAAVVGSDDVTRSKPFPDIAHRALELLDVPASDAVVVGDSVHDMEMARAAGIRTIAVTYGVADRGALLQADAIADSFDEVVKLLRR